MITAAAQARIGRSSARMMLITEGIVAALLAAISALTITLIILPLTEAV